MQSIPNAINIIYQHFTSINMVTNRDYLACSRIVLTQVNINFTSLEHSLERFSMFNQHMKYMKRSMGFQWSWIILSNHVFQWLFNILRFIFECNSWFRFMIWKLTVLQIWSGPFCWMATMYSVSFKGLKAYKNTLVS